MNSSDSTQRFIELLEEHKGIVYKIARSYVRNPHEVDDLFQDIVGHLWNSFNRYDSSFAFSTWCYRVSLNVAISHLRKNTSRRDLETEIDTISDPLHEDIDSLRLKQLKKAISMLKPLDRGLMLLRLEGLSNNEIADIMGISPSNVSSRIHRIIGRFKHTFNKKKYGTE